MPHIRIRALDETAVASLSKSLAKTLAPMMNTSEDNLTFERLETKFFRDGVATEGDPMIEVAWFDRGQETKDACAMKITELVRPLTSSEYVAVVFTAIAKTDYYENGSHF